MLKKTQDRLVVTLSLALEEIHHPGSARHSGIDIDALISGVLKEARAEHVPALAREELGEKRRAGPDPDDFPDRSDAVKQRECRARGEHKARAPGRRIA